MAAMLVYTTKECNYNSIVIVHRHGGYDVPGRGEGGGGGLLPYIDYTGMCHCIVYRAG